MRIVTKKVEIFQFEELDFTAKDNVVEHTPIDGWSEYVIEDFKESCHKVGITVDRVMFCGFYSQGDGASFTGTYRRPQTFPTQEELGCYSQYGLHSIATRLKEVECSEPVEIGVTSSFYCHSRTMIIEGCDNEGLLSIFRDLADKLYRTLEKEYEYVTSHENMAELSKANEWEFYKDGTLYS